MMRSFSSCLSGDPTNLPSPVRDCRRAWCSGAVLPAVRCVPASARPGVRRAVAAAPAERCRRFRCRGLLGGLRLARFLTRFLRSRRGARFGIGLAQRRFEAMRHLGEALIRRRGVRGRRRRCRLHCGARDSGRGSTTRGSARASSGARAGAGVRTRLGGGGGAGRAESSSASAAKVSRCGRAGAAGGVSACGCSGGQAGASSVAGSIFGAGRAGGGGVITSGCSGHEPLPFSGSGMARGKGSTAAGRASATSREAATARTILASTTTSVGPPIIRRCSTLSRRTRIRAAAGVDAGIINDAEPRLAAARAGAAELAAAEAAQSPMRLRRSNRARAGMPGRISRRTASPCRTHHPKTFAVLPVLRRQPIGRPMVNSAGNICRRDY